MNHLRMLSMTTLCIVWSITAQAQAPSQGMAEEAGDWRDALDRDLHQRADRNEFSGVVLVAAEGQPVFRQAYGLAEKRFDVPNGIDTRFNLGSIDKMFTKVAVGQLLEAGKLSLNEPIATYLPDYPRRDAAEKITVRHLIDHTSGLGDIFNPKFEAAAKDQLRAPRDYYPIFADEPLLFEPGEQKSYSNAGYIVLGAIIEAVTGQEYHSHVREHVFVPAGMTATGPVDADSAVANVATGYTSEQSPEGELRSNRFLIPFTGTPAGGGYSNVDDLSRFVTALAEGRLLSAAYTRWFFSGSVRETADWSVPPFMFAGGGPGVNAIVARRRDHTAVILSNYDSPAAMSVARSIRSIMATASPESKSSVLASSKPEPPASASSRPEPPASAFASQQPGPPYRIGAAFRRDGCDVGEIRVGFVSPGGPAERGGLRRGDIIVAIDDQPLEAEPVAHLDRALSTPSPVTFDVRRSEVLVRVTVEPELSNPEPETRSGPKCLGSEPASGRAIAAIAPSRPGPGFCRQESAGGPAIATIEPSRPGPGCCSQEPAGGRAIATADMLTESVPNGSLLRLESSLATLTERFNDGREKLRFVALLSPTCGGCLAGARAIRESILKELPDTDISVHVVWLPMLSSDDEAAAYRSASLLDDPRVQQYWDSERSSGWAYSRQVFPDRSEKMLQALPGDHVLRRYAGAGEGPLWDIYMLYQPGIEWSDGPAEPTSWVMQTIPGEVLIWKNDFGKPPFGSSLEQEIRILMQEALAAGREPERTAELGDSSKTASPRDADRRLP